MNADSIEDCGMADLEKLFKEKKREEARQARYSKLSDNLKQRYKERKARKIGNTLSPNPLLPKRNKSCRDLLLKKAEEPKVETEPEPVILSRRVSVQPPTFNVPAGFQKAVFR